MASGRQSSVMRVLVSSLLALAAAACGPGSYTPTGGDVADAGPDQAAREAFVTDVAPLMVACDACHKTGTMVGAVTAPIFESTYESVTGYTSTTGNPDFLSCSAPASSWLIGGAEATGHPGGTFDPAGKTTVVQWITMWSTVSPSCMGMMGGAAVTGKIVPQATNTVDLSALGPGLEGATMTFTIDNAGGGLLISNIVFNAGAGGLKVVHPKFESCETPPNAVGDPTDSLANVDITVPAAGTNTLIQSVSLAGVPITAPLAVSFVTLTPEAGSQGPAVDNGGACAP